MAELRRAAALSVRIIVRLAEELRVAVNDEHACSLRGWARTGDRSFSISCSEQEKGAVVQGLGSLPVALDDIEILQPSLDEMYAHFLKREDQ
jgi:Cu-processing system ATP-binding protein